MKKLIITLCLNLIVLSSASSTFANADSSTTTISKENKQLLIDDWVDYKIITYQVSEITLNPEEITTIITNEDSEPDEISKKMFENSEKYTALYIKKLNAFKPRTQEMQQLVQSQINNIEITLKLMQNHFIERNEDNQKMLESDFDKGVQITSQTQDMERSIEIKVLQYLKSFR